MTTQEMYEDKRDDGSIMRLPAVRWRNDGARPVRLRLLMEESRWIGNKLSQPRYLELEIAPGADVLLPDAHSQGIQQTRCTDERCQRLAFCRDPAHEKVIVGGAGVSLSRVSAGGATTSVHPALVGASFIVKPPSPAGDDDSLLARAAAVST